MIQVEKLRSREEFPIAEVVVRISLVMFMKLSSITKREDESKVVVGETRMSDTDDEDDELIVVMLFPVIVMKEETETIEF